MSVNNPVESFSRAIHSAIFLDLPPIPTEMIDWSSVSAAERKTIPHDKRPMKTVLLRPELYQLDIRSYYELWGSTALGFGGIGGAAMTYAQTVIITASPTNHVAVYWSGRLGYLMNVNDLSMKDAEKFLKDIKKASLSRRDAQERYPKGYIGPNEPEWM